MTLFPSMFSGPLDESIIARAVQRGLLAIHLHNIRDWTTDRHHVVDDYPYGGGAGMVLKPDALAAAIESVAAPGVPVILLSPAGRPFRQDIARALARHERLVLVCGHYEGIDERVRERWITDEISIGDYVLTGGELPAMVLIDAVSRLVPGVVEEESLAEESHEAGLLEYPHYTRPPEFRGMPVPDILLSGHHAEIARWRRRQSLRLTWLRRPDLLARADLSKDDVRFLAQLERDRTERKEGATPPRQGKA